MYGLGLTSWFCVGTQGIEERQVGTADCLLSGACIGATDLLWVAMNRIVISSFLAF